MTRTNQVSYHHHGSLFSALFIIFFMNPIQLMFFPVCLVTVLLLLLPYLSHGPVSILLALAYSCLVLPVLVQVQNHSADGLRDYAYSESGFHNPHSINKNIKFKLF